MTSPNITETKAKDKPERFNLQQSTNVNTGSRLCIMKNLPLSQPAHWTTLKDGSISECFGVIPLSTLRSKTCIVRNYTLLIQRLKGLQVAWWRSALIPYKIIIVLLGTTSSKAVFSSQVTSRSCLVNRGSKASWGCNSHLRVRAWWAANRELQCKAWCSPTQPCLIIRCISVTRKTVFYKAELA